MSMVPHVVAVVDADESDVAIWHVDTGPDIGLNRMCGAWVLPNADSEKIVLLTRNRILISTDRGDKVVRDAGAVTTATLDVVATVAAVAAERDMLQAEFEKKKSKTMIAPDWPELPEPFTFENPPTAARADSEIIAVAFGVAEWVHELAKTWAKIEKQRLARTFLVEFGGRSPRPCPIVAADLTTA